MTKAGVKFVRKTVPRSAHTCAGRVATLSHKILDHTVEDGAIIKALAGQENKIVDCLGGPIGKKLYPDLAFFRVQDGGITFLRVNLHLRWF